MPQEPWEVRRYIDERGVCPIEDWLLKLDRKTQTRVEARLDRIVDGNFGDCKPIAEGLYELRFFFGSGYRIYYAVVGRQIVILLAGGDKKSQSKDIRMVKSLWNRFQAD